MPTSRVEQDRYINVREARFLPKAIKILRKNPAFQKLDWVDLVKTSPISRRPESWGKVSYRNIQKHEPWRFLFWVGDIEPHIVYIIALSNKNPKDYDALHRDAENFTRRRPNLADARTLNAENLRIMSRIPDNCGVTILRKTLKPNLDSRQFEILCEDKEQVLRLQGTAGSGKTEVLLQMVEEDETLRRLYITWARTLKEEVEKIYRHRCGDNNTRTTVFMTLEALAMEQTGRRNRVETEMGAYARLKEKLGPRCPPSVALEAWIADIRGRAWSLADALRIKAVEAQADIQKEFQHDHRYRYYHDLMQSTLPTQKLNILKKLLGDNRMEDSNEITEKVVENIQLWMIEGFTHSIEAKNLNWDGDRNHPSTFHLEAHIRNRAHQEHWEMDRMDLDRTLHSLKNYYQDHFQDFEALFNQKKEKAHHVSGGLAPYLEREYLWLDLVRDAEKIHTGGGYDLIMVDEVQDMVETEIRLIIGQLNPGGRIIFSGDSLQKVRPCRFRWGDLQHMLYLMGHLKNWAMSPPKRLGRSYRCSNKVYRAAHRLTEMMTIANDERIPEPDGLTDNTGSALICKSTHLQSLLDGVPLKENASIVVIHLDEYALRTSLETLQEAWKEHLRLLFDAKGLEWERVILFIPAQPKDSWTDDLTNWLYTALTRARQDFLLVGELDLDFGLEEIPVTSAQNLIREWAAEEEDTMDVLDRLISELSQTIDLGTGNRQALRRLMEFLSKWIYDLSTGPHSSEFTVEPIDLETAFDRLQQSQQEEHLKDPMAFSLFLQWLNLLAKAQGGKSLDPYAEKISQWSSYYLADVSAHTLGAYLENPRHVPLWKLPKLDSPLATELLKVLPEGHPYHCLNKLRPIEQKLEKLMRALA